MSLTAVPANPVPGQAVRFVLNNDSAGVVQLAASQPCVVRLGDCTGIAVAAPQCPPSQEILGGGGAFSFTWDQMDVAGNQVPDGTYSFEVSYDSFNPQVSHTCCVTITVARPTVPTLLVDGRTSVKKLMNDRVEVMVTGPMDPGLPVGLLGDTQPGPVSVLGLTLPVAASPALICVPIGVTSPTGTLSVDFRAPAFPDSVGQIFLGALIMDPAAPVGLVATNGADLTVLDRDIDLAGNTLPSGEYPFFEHVTAFNEGSPVELGFDPTRYPDIIGVTADVYVVASKTRSEWLMDNALADVRGAPQTISFEAGGIQDNTFTLDTGLLSGDTGGTGMGVPYDIVVDVDRNGTFDMDGGDFADGYDDDEAGFYVVHDIGQPGPLAVSDDTYGFSAPFTAQKLYYPTDIAQMGQLPLVIVSHGNGHNYQWYDHIGNHLASYGYIVMSHANNTQPGPVTASTSTLNNIDLLLDNQGNSKVAGGALNGHIDSSRISWIGHSRGGEGVVIAYDRLQRGLFTPQNYRRSDIQLVSSIAPTDFQNLPQTNPHGVNYHLWVGQADNDVHGCPVSDLVQWYQVLDRADETRQSISIYGAGHGDFHAGSGGAFASGPNLIGRAATHQIMLPYLLALTKRYNESNVPALDYLWRQYESFRAISAPTGSNIHVNLQLSEGASRTSKLVIDDFQSNTALNLASSGAAVSFDMPVYRENRMDDRNITFTHDPEDGFNGFINDGAGDNSRGIAFNLNGAADYELTFHLLPSQSRFCDYTYLSFRAAQASRHTLTQVALEDFTFVVTLRDGSGQESSVEIGAYGGGVEEPYQRNGGPRCGTKRGWSSEFETIRIRLTDFLSNGNVLDLTDITELAFEFDTAQQSRLGMDDIELVK